MERFDTPELIDEFAAMGVELSDEFFEAAINTIPEGVWVNSWDFISTFCAR